jgi:hypothetical protein
MKRNLVIEVILSSYYYHATTTWESKFNDSNPPCVLIATVMQSSVQYRFLKEN